MKQVTEMSMLEILKREDKALDDMRYWGGILMDARARQMEAPNEIIKEFHEEQCQNYTARRDEALRQLNEARYDLKSYCNYYGIGKRR